MLQTPSNACNFRLCGPGGSNYIIIDGLKLLHSEADPFVCRAYRGNTWSKQAGYPACSTSTAICYVTVLWCVALYTAIQRLKL